MNYRFKNNALIIKEDGLNIYQTKNSYNNKPFADKDEALIWLRKYLDYMDEEIQVFFNKEKFKFRFDKTVEEGTENVIISKLQIKNFSNDNVVYEEKIELHKINEFNLPKLANGQYYLDIKFDNNFCLLNVDDTLFNIGG